MDISLNTIYSTMILNSKKFSELDLILCNRDYRLVSDNTALFNGIQCKNYRKVEVDNSGNKVNLLLRVGSIDLDSKTDQPNWRSDFINRFCDISNENIKSFITKSLLTDENTIYFKGAYTVFPTKWQEIRNRSEFDRQKVDIYKYATRGILMNILPLLKKVGFKTIIVDPEPGFHPGTVGKSDEEKLAGLINLYKSMGLVEIPCNFRTSALQMYNNAELYGLNGDTPEDTIMNIRGLSNKPRNLDYDIPVMIGDIDVMINKINEGRGILPYIISSLGSILPSFIINPSTVENIRTINEFDNVPKRFSEINDDYITVERYNELKSSTPPFMKKYDSMNTDEYYLKYLKYKTKYLKLKNIQKK